MRPLHQRKLLSAAVAALFSSSAWATTVLVPAGDSTTLKNDLKNAVSGEIIILQGGTYNTGISTSVDGTAAAPITIEGQNGATLMNTTGTGEGIEVNNDYYIFQSININGFQESFRTFGASYCIADNINASNSKIEAFKFKNTSQHWLVENCSATNAGMEGFYVGDANQNWTGGVPDASGDITFYHDTDFSSVNDGFDDKEGSHDIRIIDCSVDFNNTVPGANNEGDSGVYNRANNVTVINLNVLNNGSQGNGERIQTSTVNSISYGAGAMTYGLVANNIQGSLIDDVQPSAQLFNNFSMTDVAGGLLESGSRTPLQPAASTFVEPTWSGFDGQFLPINMTWDNSLSAVGNGTIWDYNQQNFNDTGIPVMFFQGVGVTFNDNNNGHYAVTLNTTVSPGMVTVSNSAGNYTINGSGSIAGTGHLTKSGTANLTLNTVDSYTGSTNVMGGTLVVGVHGALPSGAIIISAGTLQLGAGTGLAQMTSLSITGTGMLDVNNNHVVINYGSGTDPIASIATWIKSGYANGAWNGTGINSTAAQTNSASYGIGYADAADPGNPAGLASGTLEIMYTLLGDANLDGKVNGTDFAILATNFNQAVGGWDGGDFNYDGKANGTDFADLASNFNQGANQASDTRAINAFASINGLAANVPEPVSVAITLAGLMMLAQRSKSFEKPTATTAAD